MKKYKIGKHVIEMFDGINELPMSRFHAYNKYLLIDSGIGSDLSAMESHFERIAVFLKTDISNALKELNILRMSIYQINEQMNTKHLAFACLVHSIDGKPFDNTDESTLKKIIEMLKDATVKEIDDTLTEVKKKISTEIDVYFPELSSNSDEKEYYDLLKRYSLLKLEQITDGKDNKELIEKLHERIVTFSPPLVFWGNDSVEVKHDKDFESMCLVISQNLHTDPKKFTVMQFYNSSNYLKDQAKEAKKRTKRN